MERKIAYQVIECVRYVIDTTNANKDKFYLFEYACPVIVNKSIREIIDIFRFEKYIVFTKCGNYHKDQVNVIINLYDRAIQDINACLQQPLVLNERIEFNELKIKHENLCAQIGDGFLIV